ncbi:hypothetical protein DCAR_0209591 [Daucus carota subsp. sativus]|uniref:Uncharacterized protein n=1 Tax=Daucus carota subsp. sativus TaxID=79200 RepID=A0A166FDL4_DAUCS|nr:PREDICTED: zinc finger protein ZAT9-like [Daucus carota subsp. sativus]WOG90347.1 hypothetical protein DCAR_0209591 [Daucus carota subsp. sativus]
MRSHMFPLPLPPKHQLTNESPESPPSPQPQKDFIYELRENPKKSIKLVDPHFLELGSGLLPQDSDTESVTELLADEDVAACLMTLSRDKWRVKAPSQTRKRSYKCETCNKEFGTFQALGGHGTSHKKVKKRLDHDESMEEKPRKNKENVGRKLHECPVCFRVFGSGQALGGHKRSHFLGSSSTSVSTSSSTSPKQTHEVGFSFIDLNLPLPIDP